MRYVIGIIAGVVLIMGAVGGMENDTLNITYSLKMMVIGAVSYTHLTLPTIA